MKHRRRAAALAVAVSAVALLLCGGCLELCGQRIAMRYDQAADRLSFVVSYDGIHDSERGSRNPRRAEEQLRAFVADGDVMLFDWFGHVRREAIRAAARGDGPPRLAAFAQAFLDSLETALLGHYRDADGRLGVTQLVHLHRAAALVAAANAAIDEAILALADDADPAWARTVQRWKALARRGHGWLALDGHSLLFRCAVDEGEWTRGKLAFLAALAEAWQEAAKGGKASLEHRLLAAAPLSLSQSGAEVALRLGDSDAPSTLRVLWRDDYDPGVEALVQELVPDDLDRRLARCLLGEAVPDAALAELLAFGPAEERVRAVLAELRGPDGAARARAMAWLEGFARTWNARHRAPEAPIGSADADEAARRWAQWYRAIAAPPRP